MSDDINNKEVGNRVRSIRKENGMTTEKFGAEFNPPASKGTVSKWENGHYLPNNERLVRIAELGKISVDELLYGSSKQHFFSALPTVDIEDLEMLFDYYLLKYEDNPYQDETTIQNFYSELGRPLLDNIKEKANKEASKNATFAFMYSSYVWLDYSIMNKVYSIDHSLRDGTDNKNTDSEMDLHFTLSEFSLFELKRAIQTYNNAFNLDDEDFNNAKERIELILEDNKDFIEIDFDHYFNDDYIKNLLKEE